MEPKQPTQKKDNTYMSYEEKKALFDGMLTLYGRKPVHEALLLPELTPYRLHLADSNKPSGIIKTITDLAKKRNVDIQYHNRQALSRISKNSKQDQGVVLDIEAPAYQPTSALNPKNASLQNRNQVHEFIALENVTNPQNVGMTIRTVGASPCAGIILPKRGNASIDALVIKASAGTALKVPIYYCSEAISGIKNLKDWGFMIIGLSSYGDKSLNDINPSKFKSPIGTIFVLGNETKGLSKEMLALCDDLVQIPLNNGVESLNVSIAAGIVAFRSTFQITNA